MFSIWRMLIDRRIQAHQQIDNKGVLMCVINTIIHFDHALCSYFAPMMAKLYFPVQSVARGVILVYGLYAMTCLARIFGLFIFRYIGSQRANGHILYGMMLVIGVVFIVMHVIPTQSKFGWALFFIGRLLLEMGLAGEQDMIKLYIFRCPTACRAKRLSAWYEFSTMFGIVIATLIVMLYAAYPVLVGYWRLPFILAGLLTLWCVCCNKKVCDDMHYTYRPLRLKNTLIQFLANYQSVLRIAVAAGFSYATYATVFVGLTNLIPLISTIDYNAMLLYDIPLLCLDMILLGYIGKKWTKYCHNHLMGTASGLVALGVIPLFSYLSGASLVYVLLVKIVLLCAGVVFGCFFTYWSKEQLLDSDNDYLCVNLSYILGSSIIGKSTVGIFFYLFHRFATPIAPACYLAVLAFIVMLIIASSVSYD